MMPVINPGGAQDSSPRREPWGSENISGQPRQGATEILGYTIRRNALIPVKAVSNSSFFLIVLPSHFEVGLCFQQVQVGATTAAVESALCINAERSDRASQPYSSRKG